MSFLIWLATLLSLAGAAYSLSRTFEAWKATGFDAKRTPSPGKSEVGAKGEDAVKNGSEAASGIVHVLATFKNTIVTVTDESGSVLGWSSSGKLGIRGTKKSTAEAARLVSQDACRQAKESGLRSVRVMVKGQGPGRDSAVKAATGAGFDVRSIEDVTQQPEESAEKV